jgi:hypothetical protein
MKEYETAIPLMTAPTKESAISPSAPSALNVFSGAPLDFVKVVAACLMVVDHVNYVFFDHVANFMWYLGRPVFPLFAFALVCNLMRGANTQNYLEKLILFGILSQPIYATLVATEVGNTLFTLAVAAVLVVSLRSWHPVVQHLVFLAGIATIFSQFFRAQQGLDYGLAGMLFPAALYLVLEGKWSYILWLVLLLFALNWFPVEAWKLKPIQVACFAGTVSILVALVALALKDRPRFLPRYALHIFYPSHLLALLALRQWL